MIFRTKVGQHGQKKDNMNKIMTASTKVGQYKKKKKKRRGRAQRESVQDKLYKSRAIWRKHQGTQMILQHNMDKSGAIWTKDLCEHTNDPLKTTWTKVAQYGQKTRAGTQRILSGQRGHIWWV